MPYINFYDTTKLSVKKRKDRLNAGDKYMTGINGDAGLRVQPDFLPKGDRKVIQNPDSAAAIIMDNNPEYSWVDRDKKHTGAGDYASRIHIVAGVRGHYLREGDADDPTKDGLSQVGEIFHSPLTKEERDDALKEKDMLKYHGYTPIEDAAGIYLNQKGNPQRKFKLQPPNIDASSTEWKAMSDVTAYADVVQLVGRQAVNIYGGLPQSETLSSGVENINHMGVNLIWGNRISDYEKNKNASDTLEPLVKARKLETVINDVIDRISEVKNSVDKIARDNAIRYAFLAFHTHPAVLAYTFPSPELIANWAANIVDQIFLLIDSLFAEINKALLKVNTSPISAASFASKKNKTN